METLFSLYFVPCATPVRFGSACGFLCWHHMGSNRIQWVVGSYGNPLQSNIKNPHTTLVSLTDEYAPCSMATCRISGQGNLYRIKYTQSMQLYSYTLTLYTLSTSNLTPLSVSTTDKLVPCSTSCKHNIYSTYYCHGNQYDDKTICTESSTPQ